MGNWTPEKCFVFVCGILSIGVSLFSIGNHPIIASVIILVCLVSLAAIWDDGVGTSPEQVYFPVHPNCRCIVDPMIDSHELANALLADLRQTDKTFHRLLVLTALEEFGVHEWDHYEEAMSYVREIEEGTVE